MKQQFNVVGGPVDRTRAYVLRRSVAVIVAASLIVPASAFGTPAQSIAQARAEAEAARERIEDLAAQLEERSEEYYAVQAQLEKTREDIRLAEADLETAVAEVDAAEVQLNDRVGSIYRDGRLDIFSVLLGVTDFRDFVSRMDLLRRIGRSDAVLVARVKDAKDRVERKRTELETRRVEQSALVRAAAQKRGEVDAALTEQKGYLASIDQRLKKLIAQERERREKLARERAARAAAEAAARAASGSATSGSRRPFDQSALGSANLRVVGIARSFIGKSPYVWGGSRPSGFDCSGLTMYCYREIGIALPRTSRQQFKTGAYVPPERLDLLAPGDLVFFGTDGNADRVHHVGIYSGGGNYIHAPYSGALVTESSLIERIESRGDYVGATRP